jgi:hypothetical protein
VGVEVDRQVLDGLRVGRVVWARLGQHCLQLGQKLALDERHGEACRVRDRVGYDDGHAADDGIAPPARAVVAGEDGAVDAAVGEAAQRGGHGDGVHLAAALAAHATGRTDERQQRRQFGAHALP